MNLNRRQFFKVTAAGAGASGLAVMGMMPTNAWAEVRLPQGWLGFDVSNQCLADGRYVRLAIGADYADACPVRGMRLGGGVEHLQTAVQVSHGAQAGQQ